MPKTPAQPLPPVRPAPAYGSAALGWAQNYARFAAAFWTGSASVVATSLGRTARDAAGDVLQSAGPAAVLRGLLRNYVDGVTQLAITAGNAIEGYGAIGGAVAARQVVMIDGKPFPVPAVVRDASQGWAIYFVDAGIAQSALGAAAADFQLLDAGAGRTPLAILGVDYRDSDFGAYPELVVALFVQPKGQNAAMPLVHYLAIVVSQPFTRDAARAVWGLEKVLIETCATRHSAGAVRFEVAPDALAISFPRFGDGRSAAMPVHALSFRNGRALHSVMQRTGAGEGMQIGGSVTLTLGQTATGTCICRGDAATCLCETLRRCDIAGYFPAANGWTETMTGEFRAGVALEPETASAVGK